MACPPPRHPSRRQVLVWAGAGAATLALASCAGEEEAPPLPRPGERLLPVSEVPVGQSAAVTTSEGAELVVTRPAEDEVVVLSAVCTHQGCTVRRERENLVCPCHGSTFAAVDGAVLQGPAEEPLTRVPARIESGDVVVG
ncbi:Rieske (2Fe-2S) protein [Georgenia sp. H159]|uniref:QcrA and Rieske domain-containing protein n=1 Tax=Georgenia sp. H159 TaxID=3076115 RepID=UPI002D76C1FD|nr:Rieske (2Fe-2S) protein [Georgenia sp. H159]